MVGLGERAILRCKGAKTASFASWITWSRAFWGICRFLVSVPSCTCDIDIMWGVHANGGVLIMVGLGERPILSRGRGKNFLFCSMDHLVLGVLGVLQIFNEYASLHMC